ncbi:MAG: hypothetical protein ACTS9Y_00640 [Methylophilus sp.]|uniref:hypothetical protein n=1 Tax=Methylophilus sp. TaxID=29541 RepID=UPI003F9F8308
MSNNKIQLALIELSSSGVFSGFMSREQRRHLKAKLTSDLPESTECAEKLFAVSQTIRTMPGSYGTNFIDNPDKVIQLRYFKQGITAWVIEKDSGSNTENMQLQAFGYVDLYGHGLKSTELGYLCIEEYLQAGMELDIDFVPATYKTLIEQNA